MELVKYQNTTPERLRKVWYEMRESYDHIIVFNGLCVKIHDTIYFKDTLEFREALTTAREQEEMWRRLNA